MTLAETLAALVAAVAAHGYAASHHETPHGGNGRTERASVVAGDGDACVVTVAVVAESFGGDNGPASHYRPVTWNYVTTRRWRVPLGALRDVDLDDRHDGEVQDVVRLRGREPLRWTSEPPVVGSGGIPHPTGADARLDVLADGRAGARAMAVAFKRAAAACARRRPAR